MTRELVVLGTACQTPTRQRNHNGYLLRFDEHGFLFDPGEGTQRQMLLAGCAPADVDRICVTHFHGDHSLGLAGVLQRMSLDEVPHPIHCHYPASGQEYFNRLRYSSSYWERAVIVEEPITEPAVIDCGGVTLTTAALEHRLDCFGYRVTEPDGRSMLPDRLGAAGISGPDIGRLQREGRLETADGTVTLEEMSVLRRGQVFAFIMDTRVCAGATELAAGADLVVCESTYLETDADMAQHYRHLTARQAGRLAAEGGVRELVLTHFSRRYPMEEMERFRDEASSEFSGVVHLAEDLMRIPFPSRRPSAVGDDAGRSPGRG